MRRTRYSQRLLAAAALAASLLSAPPLALADPRYAVTTVAGAGSWANDLNNAGQVVGYLQTGSASHAFVYTSGVLNDIGTLGGNDSGANAINDLGQVVGNSSTAGGAFSGFLYSGGVMTALNAAPYMQAFGINNSGTIVGSMFVTTPEDSYRHAYTLTPGGTLTDLGTLSYGDGSVGIAINSSGVVVGAAANMFNGAPNYPEDPFIYQGGVMTGLGNLGGPWSAALSVNDLGQVVGYLGIDSLPGNPGELYPTTAFLYAGGTMNIIGGLFTDGVSIASDINNLGQVVGSARGPDGGLSHAFLYENGVLTDLNALIDPASGWTITDAAAINDVQQIAATACRAGVCQAIRLDLVSAVPEPSMFALMAGGLALCLARGRLAVRRPVRRRPG
jgi:probable HAF family extracellular repeat protein